MEVYDEWFKLDENVCGRDTRLWCFIIQKHGTDYKKTKNLQTVTDIIDAFECLREDEKSGDEVYENSTISLEATVKCWKEHKEEFFKHKYINSNKFQKIDEIVKDGDFV